MVVLVAGSCCAGKSTYIAHRQNCRDAEIGYGYELAEIDPAGRQCVHYNLLFLAEYFPSSRVRNWRLLDDPGLAGLLASGQVERAVVIVASRKVLIDRAEARMGRHAAAPGLANRLAAMRRAALAGLTRGGGNTPFDWRGVIRNADLAALHDQLLALLDEKGIPVEVLDTTQAEDNGEPSFAKVERGRIRGILGGRARVPGPGWMAPARAMVWPSASPDN